MHKVTIIWAPQSGKSSEGVNHMVRAFGGPTWGCVGGASWALPAVFRAEPRPPAIFCIYR